MGPLTLLVAYAIASAQAEFYETFSGEQISPAKFAQYRALGLVPYCAQDIPQCDEKEPRRMDLSCNNLHHPIRGTTMTPYRRMLAPVFGRNYDFRPQGSGNPLPNIRSVRTSILPDGRVASKKYTSQLMGGLLIITGDCTTIHDTFNYLVFTPTCCATGEADPRCRPIYVPDDDIHLRYSADRCLNLTRVINYQDLGCAPRSLPPERINLAAPMLELSSVYGSDAARGRRGRELRGGRLRVDIVNGREWPPTGSYYCVLNQPLLGETRCHDSPDLAPNLLIQPNVFVIWLFRNHNRIARELERMNPCWDDEKIFLVAREINIATVNQIWYYEMFPAILGYEYLRDREIVYDTPGHINDYNPKLEPRVTIEWVVMTRWFHSMQDGRLNKYSRKGRLLEELKIVDYTLRTGSLPVNGTIEGITQGFFRQGTAEADHLIDPEMGERILDGLQRVSDIASTDIQKGREAAFPPYVEYRKHCHLYVPKKFEDLLEIMPAEKVDALRFRYERVEDIELYPGVAAEKLLEGPIPPTLKCIMADQLWWWRKADRFWFENNQHPWAFTEEQLHAIRHSTMSRIVCDNGDDVDSIQPQMFLLPGPGNEITSCTKIPKIDLKPWKDHCGKDEDYEEDEKIQWGPTTAKSAEWGPTAKPNEESLWGPPPAKSESGQPGAPDGWKSWGSGWF